ncbi:MAG: type IV pilus biogenesis/stability protein PilW [Gammaproteobacteria bacterium]|nr:type IV pilus biogenesis/stability protein PilW [Gammaproteobacteria bacterium]
MNYRVIVLILSLFGLAACAPVSSRGGELQTDYDANEIAQANMRLGVAYMEDGNYEKALEKLERARKADPGYPMAHNMLGLLYQRMGESGKAEESFKRGLREAPNNSNLLNNYGQFLCGQNRPDEAEQAFLKARDNPLNDNPARALTNAGTCAFINNNTDKAETYYRDALQLNPQQSLALIRMAEIQYGKGEYLSARGYLQRYLEVARHTPRSLWLGIRIERELGDNDTLSSYALLLNSNFPDSEEARLLRESGLK